MSHPSYAPVNGLQMYYEVYGQGDPVLLLHGGSATLESFCKQIPELSRHFKVIAAESRGHGRTADAPGPLSYAQMAEDFVALIRYLGLPSVSIVGWSDGGVIGLHLAMHYPELVDKLVTFGANFHYQGVTDEFKAAVENSESKDHPAFLVSLYEKLSPDGPEHWPIFFAKLKEMWLTSPTYTAEDLAKITVPTMILVGDKDIVKPRHTIEMFEAIPEAQLCVLPGADHFVPFERPDVVNRLVLEFLKPETVQRTDMTELENLGSNR